MSIVAVLLLILINRWLWPVSQSYATIFSGWQPPLSAAFTYFSMKTVPFCPFPRKRCKQSKTQQRNGQLDGVERDVGVKVQLSDVQPGPLSTAGFHTPCYRRFTDNTKIARSVIRCAKVGLQTSLSLTILWKLVMTPGGNYYLLLRTLSICLQREGRQCLNMFPLP